MSDEIVRRPLTLTEVAALPAVRFGLAVDRERIEDTVLALEVAREELKLYRAGVEAVLGTVEREKKRADQALSSQLEIEKQVNEKLFGKDYQPMESDSLIRVSAQSHQAGRILSNVRYAFKNAGLPVATISGEPKLLK